MITAQTEGGKKIELILDRTRAVYKFQFNPGGELPQELSGIFMEERSAKVALSRYLEKNKSKKNG